MKARIHDTSSQQARPRRALRGFTLVELMVALSGGLFLSMVVFALARDTNRFYQQQTRLANATLSGIVGFDRLRVDIARAGYLTTPDWSTDPRVCRPTAATLASISGLRSVQISASSPVPAALADNGIAPQKLRISGSFSSSDEFPIRGAFAEGAAPAIYLQPNTGPMARLGYDVSTGDGGDSTELLETVFKKGRIVRLQDKSGHQHFSVIDTVVAGAEPHFTLRADAPIAFRGRDAEICGIKGMAVGATVSVVNVVEYEIKSLREPLNDQYAPLFAAGVSGPYDDRRTELVRTEYDADGNVIEVELVAEYAVDLAIGLTAWDKSSSLVSYLPGDTDDFEGGVQHLRALRARLAVRSREADRSADVDPGLEGRYRIGLGASGGAPFARVRTFQADVALHNHGRTEW